DRTAFIDAVTLVSQATQSIGGTVTVSGSPLAGVHFSASNGGNCLDSNGAGQYTCTVPLGWSGSVTPSLIGYNFTPPTRSYASVVSDQSSQNFTAAPVADTATAWYTIGRDAQHSA